MRELWQGWIEAWRDMEAHALRRGWKVVPLEIAPPASEQRVADLEAAHSLAMPAQLRDLLTGWSSAIRFGWRIPSHLRPAGDFSSLTSGGLRDTIWDLAHIDRYAIANFRNWQRHYADHSGPSEEPNSPDMWEHQFPFADLINGDMLTIDVRSTTTQPVRYFSHELEGLHGAAIAPDFHAFVTEYSALGCAGATHDDWFAFCPTRPDGHRYLAAQTPAGRAWIAFVARDVGSAWRMNLRRSCSPGPPPTGPCCQPPRPAMRRSPRRSMMAPTPIVALKAPGTTNTSRLSLTRCARTTSP